MKYILLILLAFPLFAADYSFLHYETDYDQARKKAMKNHKLLMLLVVKNDCGWCYKLAFSTLQTPKVKRELHKNFQSVLLNRDSDPIPNNYSCPVVPALYFIDPVDNEEVWRSKGYQKQKKFLKLLGKALQSHQADLADEAD
jgi:hypothetical protein